MTRIFAPVRSFKGRAFIGAAMAIAALGLQASTANAYSNAVKQACTNDYFSFCSHTAPGSAKLRRCMRKAGTRLSHRCVKALIKAGLAPKSSRRRRSSRR